MKRFSTVKIFYNDVYEVQLPLNHRFPMNKYRIVREGLQEEYQGNCNVSFETSPFATFQELSTTHCPQYINRYITNKMTGNS